MQHASNVTHLHNIAARQEAVTGREAKPKLLDQLREALRSRHYSRRTEQTYCHWVKRFIYFHNVRHPSEMLDGSRELGAVVSIYPEFVYLSAPENMHRKVLINTPLFRRLTTKKGEPEGSG